MSQSPISFSNTMAYSKELWILEDDEQTLLVYEDILRHRYSYRKFRDLTSFTDAYRSSNNEKPGLLIADVKFTDGSFIGFLGNMSRQDLVKSKVLIVSHCDDIHVIRHCLHLGVADFLIKPVNRSELLVKIERITAAFTCTLASLKFDFLTKKVRFFDVESEKLTDKEIQILTYLHRAHKHILARSQLTAYLWPDESREKREKSKRIDVHIHNVRNKIAKIGLRIDHIPPHSYQLLPQSVV